MQAFKTLGLETVSTLAEQLLAGLFNIVVAVVIFGVGLFLSRVAYKTISPTGEGQSALLGNVARVAILIFTGAMALFRAGLASRDRDPRLRGGDRGPRPRRRPRLRPGRAGGGREDRRRLAREVLTFWIEPAGSAALPPAPSPRRSGGRVFGRSEGRPLVRPGTDPYAVDWRRRERRAPPSTHT